MGAGLWRSSKGMMDELAHGDWDDVMDELMDEEMGVGIVGYG